MISCTCTVRQRTFHTHCLPERPESATTPVSTIAFLYHLVRNPQFLQAAFLQVGERDRVSPASRFPAEPSSAHAARHFVRVFLRTRPAAIVDTVVLLTSELVTNALVHARSVVEVDLTNTGGMIRIAVTDDSSELPKIEPSVTLSEHGRGVPLVATLSDDWGVEQTHFGKTIWFILNPPATRRHLPSWTNRRLSKDGPVRQLPRPGE